MSQYHHNSKSAHHYLTVSALAMSTALAAATIPAQAQQTRPQQTAAAESGVEEVIVTARKRQETLVSVPVIETAITKSQLDSMQATSLEDLPKIAPGLVISQGLGTNGLAVNLHGIGQLASATTADAAVQLNLDGIQIGTGLAFQAGLFDLGQIEVLKGPQPLFYGKGTPGGVIVLHTADPTDKFEVVGTAGYEFEARTPREELIISGPVTDTLKLRLASMYSTSEGYFNEAGVPVPGTGALAPDSKRGPGETQYIVRGTAVWNPTDQFDARLKVNLVHDRLTQNMTYELVACPDGLGAPAGIPFIGAGNTCQLGRNVLLGNMNPANFPGINNNGIVFESSDQKFGTLDLNYHLSPDLTLTSVTGYYFLKPELLLNGASTTGAGTPYAVTAGPGNNRTDWSEELRANSEFNGPLNFTLGGLYQSSDQNSQNTTIGNSAYHLPAFLQSVFQAFSDKAYSVFGQARYKITPELELAGGLRWTDVTQGIVVTNLLTHAVVPLAVPHIKSDNVAPEVTLTYRPSEDMTLFASFKEAYLSGGFTTGPIPPANSDISFHDEKAEGGEAGIKSRWLDHRLLVNVAAYYYHFSGLQVGSNYLAPNGQVVSTTVNAAAAKSYGIDIDAAYSPEAIKGLTLNGAVNWDHARFIKLDGAPCYGGQTIAAGCNEVFNATTGLFTGQSLAGTQIPRSPEWQFNFGFDYTVPVGNDYKLVLSSNVNYSSAFPGGLFETYPNHGAYQPAYAKADLGVTLQAPDDRWEIALRGNNITDKIIGGGATSSNASSSLFLPSITGGTGRSAAGIDEISTLALPGREIWLKVTLKPFN